MRNIFQKAMLKSKTRIYKYLVGHDCGFGPMPTKTFKTLQAAKTGCDNLSGCNCIDNQAYDLYYIYNTPVTQSKGDSEYDAWITMPDPPAPALAST